ncbi:hypothetical protein DUZ99_10495 [Xylanibacillus composti]|uniref:Uncharacterized protein n=1 Tax=Xylanibacillus composti TaxID=1572762 RepID=A0A8J4M4Q1_9BACL|nr:hypothetical protein [Xylanibacillus composti]MDT9725399.1 hypothetical protein [Xylanibacillus composti]GIQ71450.1 hypothetical protein XYCOK13_42740 [Xylanibacillus composti]
MKPFTKVQLLLMTIFLCIMVAYPLYYASKVYYTKGKLQNAVIAYGKEYCGYEIESVEIDIKDMFFGGSSWSAKTTPAYGGIWGESTYGDGYIELYGFGECEMEEYPYFLTKKGEFKIPANMLSNRTFIYDVSEVDPQYLAKSNFNFITLTDQFGAVIISFFLFLVGLVGLAGLLLYYIVGLISTLVQTWRDRSN